MGINRTDHFPLIIGHRGASGVAPENTLEAFHLARLQGGDGIEADFRLTADGRIVSMHDDTAVRTTGTTLAIADATCDELLHLDAGSWKGAEYAGIRIPTLDQVLVATPQRSWLFIEIKCGAEIVEPLQELLGRSGHTPERIRLLSFSEALIARCKLRMPEWHACWLCDYRDVPAAADNVSMTRMVLHTLDRCGADGLASADSPFLDRELAHAVLASGRELHVWTVDRPAAAVRLCRLGVTSIMTNYPGPLREQLTHLIGNETMPTGDAP